VNFADGVAGEFANTCRKLIGLPVTHVWRGYGSALFLEFGLLSERTLPNGRVLRNRQGEFGLGIEWSWRIEGKRRIWCGSWSDENRWPRVFACLLGSKVASISLVGRLPEIDMGLANGLHIVSMMTAEGDPQWALSEHGIPGLAFEIKAGRLQMMPYSGK
jgi:hypothetical protein